MRQWLKNIAVMLGVVFLWSVVMLGRIETGPFLGDFPRALFGGIKNTFVYLSGDNLINLGLLVLIGASLFAAYKVGSRLKNSGNYAKNSKRTPLVDAGITFGFAALAVIFFLLLDLSLATHFYLVLAAAVIGAGIILLKPSTSKAKPKKTQEKQ